ncbi:MAG TPA: hypothetical protein PKD09_24670 [Aggregatilinea sp.]|uniref:hypothetical protein n=1 Tax=Aggregatilinea sp. TaxID=2806333 RepID=UPI002BC2AABA|nr:hypothetical protein [Aggregatilinea sp.]HML24872.1 hypothetical protein [Aggregatilinea sp.]
MKISIGMHLKSGPWGGGNQFGHALVAVLRARGHEVVFDLAAPDLDVILLFDPRPQSQTASYGDAEILDYVRHVNWRALVVHRINECDERKGTTGVNARLIEANRCADHTVFVSSWLRDLFLAQGIGSRAISVILNGSDRAIFNADGYHPWDRTGPLRLVTHHWGANWLKGFDIYQRLDELLGTDAVRERFAFTYIGNLPDGFTFHNTTYLPPKHGPELAAALRENHVYLTASQNEPGGNHQNEGACCGLPLLYRESGCMPEYCAGFGVPFTAETFETALDEMAATYEMWAARMPEYPNTAARTTAAYAALFEDLVARREAILQTRPYAPAPWAARLLYRARRVIRP